MPASHRSCWTIDALTLSLDAAVAGAHEAAAGVLAYLRAARTADAAPAELSVRIVETLPPRPPAATHVGRAEPDLDVWEADGVLHLACPAGRACVDAAAGRALVAPGDLDDATWAGLVTLAVLSLLRPHGRFALHASALAHEGHGVLCVGPSGAGKSTLAYALAHAGWDYLTDDLALLRFDDGQVVARSLGRHFRLADRTLSAFAGAADAAGAEGADGKRFVDVDALHGARLADRVVPRVLLFPSIGEGSTSVLTPMPRMEALLRLIPQTLLADRDAGHASTHLDVLKTLCAQTRAYRLAAGRDVLERPEAFAARLAGVLDAAG